MSQKTQPQTSVPSFKRSLFSTLSMCLFVLFISFFSSPFWFLLMPRSFWYTNSDLKTLSIVLACSLIPIVIWVARSIWCHIKHKAPTRIPSGKIFLVIKTILLLGILAIIALFSFAQFSEGPAGAIVYQLMFMGICLYVTPFYLIILIIDLRRNFGKAWGWLGFLILYILLFVMVHVIIQLTNLCPFSKPLQAHDGTCYSCSEESPIRLDFDHRHDCEEICTGIIRAKRQSEHGDCVLSPSK